MSAQANQSTRNNILFIAISFAVMSAVLLALLLLQSVVLDSARAYVQAEGFYAKGQKDAVFWLSRYADSRDPEDFRRFERALAIPQGDRIAREALQQVEPDRQRAFDGFSQGNNDAKDIPGMIRFFLYFQDFPYVRDAIERWTEGDALIERLHHTGSELRDAVERDDAGAIERLKQQMYRLDERLNEVEMEFSARPG